MAKCKACGGSGKVKEDDKKGQDLPRSPKSPDRERDWKRKPNDYNSPAIGSVRRGRNPEDLPNKDRKNPRVTRKRDDLHKQNIESKPKNYKPLKSYRTKAK